MVEDGPRGKGFGPAATSNASSKNRGRLRTTTRSSRSDVGSARAEKTTRAGWRARDDRPGTRAPQVRPRRVFGKRLCETDFHSFLAHQEFLWVDPNSPRLSVPSRQTFAPGRPIRAADRCPAFRSLAGNLASPSWLCSVSCAARLARAASSTQRVPGRTAFLGRCRPLRSPSGSESQRSTYRINSSSMTAAVIAAGDLQTRKPHPPIEGGLDAHLACADWIVPSVGDAASSITVPLTIVIPRTLHLPNAGRFQGEGSDGPATMRTLLETGYDGHVAQEFIPTWPDTAPALRHAAKVCDVRVMIA
jgi:hypothetical protein